MERRFGQLARLTASLAYSLQMILYQGIVLYAPALALEALTGISQVAAILGVGMPFNNEKIIKLTLKLQVLFVHFIPQSVA